MVLMPATLHAGGGPSPPFSSDVKSWMERLDLRMPIPKLIPPAHKLSKIRMDTICSTARFGGTTGGTEVKCDDDSDSASQSPVDSPSSTYGSMRHLEESSVRSTSYSVLRQREPHPPPRGEVQTARSGAQTSRSAVDGEGDAARLPTIVRNHGAELQRLFRREPRSWDYFTYLLLFGGPRARLELAPRELNHDDHQLLGAMFATLDRDGDGLVNADDIKAAAAHVFQTTNRGGSEYAKANFRKIDRDCRGHVDFERFLLAFYPSFTLRTLQYARRNLEKPLTKLYRTEELMSTADLDDVRRNFRYFASLIAVTCPTGARGCSQEAYLSAVKDPETRALAQQQFESVDADKDGIIDENEYLEMVKYMYPPFRRSLPSMLKGTTEDPVPAQGSSRAQQLSWREQQQMSSRGSLRFGLSRFHSGTDESRKVMAALESKPVVAQPVPYWWSVSDPHHRRTSKESAESRSVQRHRATDVLEGIIRQRDGAALAKKLLK